MLLPTACACTAHRHPREVETAMKKALAVAALLIALPVVALATKPATRTETTTIKTTIDAIDHEARTVTFKDKEGNLETVAVGPEVKRFNELKVGDKVTFKYTESVVVKVRKPGATGMGSSSEEPAVVRSTGEKPGATVTQQQTAVVVVKAIDMKVPAVTVQTEDGRTTSFKVEDKGLLKNIKAGDKVEINYTEALVISVE
jgi:Cu/Ag efflux protein CusF